MGQAAPFSTYEITEHFDEVYNSLDLRRQKQVDKAVYLLFHNSAHPGLNAHQIKPDKYYWEAYVNRSDRIIYIPDGSHLVLVDIVRHDDIWKYGKAP